MPTLGPIRARAVGILTLALVYVATARLGLSMDAVSGFATLVWAPTGIALAALWRLGVQLWPGVFAGAFLVNLWAGAPLAAAAGIGVGNTLEAVVALYALRRVGFRPSLERLRDVVALCGLAAVASTLVSASCGVLSLALAGALPAGAAAVTFRAWWIGDLIANLVVAPVLLTWSTRPEVAPLPRRAGETLALAALIGAIGAFVFMGPGAPADPFRQPYLLFPALMWAALRFGPRGAALATLLVSAIAIAGTNAGFGPFARGALSESLAPLQVYMAVVALAGYLLAAAVAERRRAEEAVLRTHALLQAVVDGTTDSVFVKDGDGRYLLVNRAAARVLGRGADDIVGRDDAAFLPSDVASEIRKHDREVMTTGTTSAYEESIRSPDGARTFLSIKAPYRDHTGRTVGVVGISRDITDRKQAEQALHAAIGARDEFLSVASHELRTPLAALVLQLGAVQQTLARQDLHPVDLSRRVERAVRQTDRLARLVENLLDVSRIGAGRLQLEREPLDLAEVAHDVVERFGEEARRARCALAVHAPAGVATGRWDRLRLEQVLGNLLSNALKYGAGHPITVTVAAGATTATLAVRDEGIGIAPEDARRIFGRFERAVPAHHYAGLGLGLFIAREIVEAHEGALRVDSRLGEGATFTVELPRNPETPVRTH